MKKFNMLVLLVLVSLNAKAAGTGINCEQTSKDNAMCMAIPSDSEAPVTKTEATRVSENKAPAKTEAAPVSMIDKNDLASAELDISEPTPDLSRNLGLAPLQNTVQITDKLKDLYIFLNSNGIGGGNGDFKVSTSSKK